MCIILIFYQLAFFTPGIRPWLAISRKVTLDIPNRRMYPRGRPVMLQRLWYRMGDEFLGSFCRPSQSPASFKARRFSAYFAISFARLRSRAFMDSLAIFSYFFLNGKPNFSNKANASLSVSAEVTKVMSIPAILWILSKSISGKMICSLIPKL